MKSLNDLIRLDGMYVGMLTPEELAAFNEACRAGTAQRSYEGVAGFLGAPKVRIAREKSEITATL